MSGGWNSDDENRTQCSPVYSQTSGRGGSRRCGGTGRAHGNWWGAGSSDYNINDNFGAPENGQVLEGRRFRHNTGQYGAGENFQKNSSGKTFAFLLPALIHIDRQPIPRAQRRGANVLVLVPTGELALQIEKEVKKYNYRSIKCVCVYGWGNGHEQMDIVAEGVDIIIATPGRLNDLVMKGDIDVSSVTYVVLDGADHMLDMGFEPEIRKVLLKIRPDRQTVMTSATWPAGVQRFAQSLMKHPIQVFIDTPDLTAVQSATQKIKIVKEEDKEALLYEYIKNMGPDDKVIVFVCEKPQATHISSELSLSYIRCQCIYGNRREQSDREQALEDIRTGKVHILIATDVALRGIDIEGVTHIFNYDFPRNIEDYVHRVGLTGRAGRTGESVSLVTECNRNQAKALISILEEANQEVPQELRRMAECFVVRKRRNPQKWINRS